MSKHDLKARPIYHHKRESIDAHLAIVFTALAVSHWLETRTGWTIKHLIRELRRYRQVTIQAGGHTLIAEDPIPDDIRHVLDKIHPESAHQIGPTRVILCFVTTPCRLSGLPAWSRSLEYVLCLA